MLSQNQRKLIILLIQRVFIYGLQICHPIALITYVKSLYTRLKQTTSVVVLLVSQFPNIKEVIATSLLLTHFPEALQLAVSLQVFLIINQGDNMIDIFKTMHFLTIFLIPWIIC